VFGYYSGFTESLGTIIILQGVLVDWEILNECRLWCWVLLEKLVNENAFKNGIDKAPAGGIGCRVYW
jgi:hypothetical protein